MHKESMNGKCIIYWMSKAFLIFKKSNFNFEIFITELNKKHPILLILIIIHLE